jgi:hypothetical protein
MGVSIIREEMGWESVEKTKGTYALPAECQRWLTAVTGAGIKVYLVLDYGNKLYDNPLDPQAYARYAAWVAQNLKGKVAAYEIWNEPDNFRFLKQYGGAWSGADHAMWVAKYGELVAAASAAIRSVDPQAVIVHNLEGPAWVYGLQDAPKNYALVDGIDLHPYPVRFPAETVPWGGPEVLKRDGVSVADDQHSLVSFLNLQSQTYPQQYLGHTLQCWVGEYGYSTYAAQKNGAFGGFTPEAQAAYLVRGAVTGLAQGVQAWCIYDFVDDGNNPFDQESNFGLVCNRSRQYQPKLSFYALQRLAKLLGPDWQLVDKPPATLEQPAPPTTRRAGRPQQDALDKAGLSPFAADWVKVDGPQVYWFRVGQDYVTILWKAGWRNADFVPALRQLVWQNAPAGLNFTVQDLVSGQSLAAPLTRSGNTVTVSGLPLGGSPIALRWNGAAAAAPNH